MNLQIEKVKEILKTIKYPGFSRDILSFGIVKNLSIKDNKLFIEINITTDNKDTILTLENQITSLINENFAFDSIKINYSNNNNPLDANKEKIKNIIAISSCKGGVGKSTIALNIACELSKNYKVGLLDLDIYGPSLPTLIGIKSMPEMIDKKLIPIEKYNIKFMSFGFLNENNSPTIWRGPMVSRMTQQFFDDVQWGELDYLILDLPPGTGDIQLTLVQKIALNGALIVTTPQDLSHIDVAKGSDMFKKVNTPILGVVENMSHYILNGRIDNSNINLFIEDKNVSFNSDGTFSLKLDIFKGDSGKKESKRSNIPLLGKIGLDSNISECCDKGVPYIIEFPESLITKEIQSIAKKITNSN